LYLKVFELFISEQSGYELLLEFYNLQTTIVQSVQVLSFNAYTYDNKYI